MLSPRSGKNHTATHLKSTHESKNDWCTTVLVKKITEYCTFAFSEGWIWQGINQCPCVSDSPQGLERLEVAVLISWDMSVIAMTVDPTQAGCLLEVQLHSAEAMKCTASTVYLHVIYTDQGDKSIHLSLMVGIAFLFASKWDMKSGQYLYLILWRMRSRRECGHHFW